MAKNDKPFPTGAIVEKVKHHEGDKHPVGTVGRIAKFLGEVTNPLTMRKTFGYEVQWGAGAEVSIVYDDGRLALLRTTD